MISGFAFIIFVFAIIDLAMPGLGYANAFVILAMPAAGYANAFVISAMPGLGYANAFVISAMPGLGYANAFIDLATAFVISAIVNALRFLTCVEYSTSLDIDYDSKALRPVFKAVFKRVTVPFWRSRN